MKRETANELAELLDRMTGLHFHVYRNSTFRRIELKLYTADEQDCARLRRILEDKGESTEGEPCGQS